MVFKGNFSAFEKLHECRPTDAEKVCSLSGRESLALRDDEIAWLAHRRHNLEEYLVDLRGSNISSPPAPRNVAELVP